MNEVKEEVVQDIVKLELVKEITVNKKIEEVPLSNPKSISSFNEGNIATDLQINTNGNA